MTSNALQARPASERPSSSCEPGRLQCQIGQVHSCALAEGLEQRIVARHGLRAGVGFGCVKVDLFVEHGCPLPSPGSDKATTFIMKYCIISCGVGKQLYGPNAGIDGANTPRRTRQMLCAGVRRNGW